VGKGRKESSQGREKDRSCSKHPQWLEYQTRLLKEKSRTITNQTKEALPPKGDINQEVAASLYMRCGIGPAQAEKVKEPLPTTKGCNDEILFRPESGGEGGGRVFKSDWSKDALREGLGHPRNRLQTRGPGGKLWIDSRPCLPEK